MKINLDKLLTRSINTILLITILKNQRKIMATLEQFETAFQKIDTATSNAAKAIVIVGDRIAKLEETVKNQGLTAEQEAAILSKTHGIGEATTLIAEGLEKMGKDVTDPVPVEPNPEPTPNPEPETGTGTGGEGATDGEGTEEEQQPVI